MSVVSVAKSTFDKLQEIIFTDYFCSSGKLGMDE